MYFLSTFFARYFLLLLEYIYEEETVLLLRYICKIRLVTLKKNSFNTLDNVPSVEFPVTFLPMRCGHTVT